MSIWNKPKGSKGILGTSRETCVVGGAMRPGLPHATGTSTTWGCLVAMDSHAALHVCQEGN